MRRMRRLSFVAGMLLMALLVPTVATAGPINVVDPIIGVRGVGRGGSPEIDNPDFQNAFQDCGAFFGDMSDADYICLEYNLPLAFEAGLYSVDLTFTQDSSLIPNTLLDISDGEEGTNPFAGFTQFALIGTNTIRLFGGGGVNGALLCGEVACQGANSDGELQPGDDVVVYIGPNRDHDASYAVSATNPSNTPVPEPATLLLMGTAAAALGGRRLRRKSH